jgi:deoxyribodipyrimidine photo-lyase
MGRLPSLGGLGLAQEVSDPPAGGEAEARRLARRFLDGPVREYTDTHDALGSDRTSRLSPYLHFGAITPRQLEARLPRGKGAEAFRRQLCWRDFHHHVLQHFPRNARSEFQERYRGSIRWSHAQRSFEAWKQGATGYPLVDAGMRQLRREGWMHNRARLVVGSFLTKDLGIDWRWGERWFMRMLVDGDEANNNGNWQWIASVGTDPQPVYRRIYNPARHMERYDPEGRYVRRYVPELERVPDGYLAEPWTMPDGVQEEASCRIGTDYPEPIVDHREAREHALARYRVQ